MKANYKIKNGQLVFEVIGTQAKEIWSQVAQIQELFEAESECGLCKSKDLRYSHRVTQQGQFHYYELVCCECGGRFAFGQQRQGGELFPKRKKDRQPLPNGGWFQWAQDDPDEGNYDPGPPGQQPPSRGTGPQHVNRPAPSQGAAPQAHQSAPAGGGQNARDLQYAPDDFGEVPPAGRRRY